MKITLMEIENKVDELLMVLDRDIRHLEETLSRLNELRALVIKRDDVSLGRLLEKIRAESNDYRENESKRQVLRQELAGTLGCGTERMTLSRLEAEFSGERKLEISRRRIQLQTLAMRLKKEHLSTSILLSDCARFSRMLLRNILDLGNGGITTYNPKGHTEHRPNRAFVNLQF
jgi:hypothetical protein